VLDITKLEPSQLKATFTARKITHIIETQNPADLFCEAIVIFDDGRVTTCKKDGTDGHITLFVAKSGLGYKYPETKLEQFRELITTMEKTLERYMQPSQYDSRESVPAKSVSLMTPYGLCYTSELRQFIDDVAKDIAGRKEEQDHEKNRQN